LGSQTYFLPRQLRGPYEKGFSAALLSLSKRASSPVQRSGMNESGAKFLGELYMASCWQETVVYGMVSHVFEGTKKEKFRKKRKTYTSGDPISTHFGALRGYKAGQTDGHGRVHAQSLFETGTQVLQSLEVLDCDVGV
jgi:hypothetical protein